VPGYYNNGLLFFVEFRTRRNGAAKKQAVVLLLRPICRTQNTRLRCKYKEAILDSLVVSYHKQKLGYQGVCLIPRIYMKKALLTLNAKE